MPRVTQIKQTKKGRMALFLDGEFAFSLAPELFADAGVHAGDELTEAQVAQLRGQSDARRALDKAMDYLALRDHAAGELYQKLCRRFDPESAAAAVRRAGELGLLNDADVARRRAAELFARHKSRREILRDLAAKGIGDEAAAAAVEALGQGGDGADADAPELASARALLQKHYARKLAEGKRGQVAAALARRGFAHAVIRQALDEWDGCG